MVIKVLEQEFSICSIGAVKDAPVENDFVFFSKTDEEISLVCPLADVPAGALKREDGWKAFKIMGILDFGMIGVIARISQRLAHARIGIFVVSTYNTDYIFVKSDHLINAVEILGNDGYTIER